MLVLIDNEKRQLIEAIRSFWADFPDQNVKIFTTPLDKNFSVNSEDIVFINAAVLTEMNLAPIDVVSDVHVYFQENNLTQLPSKTTVLESYLSQNFSKLFMNRYRKYIGELEIKKSQTKKLLELNQKLIHSLDSFEVELVRVKKMYKQMVPVRKSLFKGVRLKSKYLTGESSGGEFFDVIEKGRQILLVMHSCNSYLASSSFITMFANFKALNSIENTSLKHFVSAIEKEIEVIHASIGKKIQSEVMLFKLDLSTLEYDLWNFGEHRAFQNDKLEIDHFDVSVANEQMDNVHRQGRLERDSRFFIFSPGLKKNIRANQSKLKESEIIASMLERESEEILDEFAIRIKTVSQSEFVKFDTSMIVFEVDKNAIFQI
jgi:hypothetical protein